MSNLSPQSGAKRTLIGSRSPSLWNAHPTERAQGHPSAFSPALRRSFAHFRTFAARVLVDLTKVAVDARLYLRRTRDALAVGLLERHLFEQYRRVQHSHEKRNSRPAAAVANSAD